MNPQLAEKRRTLRARAQRVSHPLHERLIPDLEGAPESIHEAQAAAIQAIEMRKALAAEYREAEEAARMAPVRDEQAGREALAQGNAAPKPTVGAAKATAAEVRRQFELAKDVEAEALDRLARVIAEHGDEWQGNLDDRLREQATAAAELTNQALEAWHELDVSYTLTRWVHEMDPERPKTLAQTQSLRIGDTDAGKMLAGLTRLAEQAPQRAQAGETGRQLRAKARTDRRARREQKVAA